MHSDRAGILGTKLRNSGDEVDEREGEENADEAEENDAQTHTGIKITEQSTGRTGRDGHGISGHGV
jgi:hypothetical protein